MNSGESRLRQAIAHVRAAPRGRPSPPPLQLQPTNPFEVAVKERLDALQAEMDRLHSRVNWLLTVIIGFALANLVINLVR